MVGRRPGRRAVLGGALAWLARPSGAAGARPRLAAIDWAMLETATALGVAPVAACELIRYREDYLGSRLPGSTVDLGLRGSPNFELLQLTRPDLVLSSPWYAQIAPRLERIAPVMTRTIYAPGEPPWPRALAALDALADRIGEPRAAENARLRAAREIAALTSRADIPRDRPVYVIQIGDARHFRAFGPDSMFGNMLDLLEIENAWSAPTEFSFAAPLPLERLAERPEARIIAVSGIPIVARAALRNSILWNTLPPVSEGRFSTLADINPFGGVPSGLTFARRAADVLSGTRSG